MSEAVIDPGGPSLTLQTNDSPVQVSSNINPVTGKGEFVSFIDLSCCSEVSRCR